MYHFGNGVEKNYEEAFKWYSMAALKGNDKAQFNLATLHFYGKGTEVDKSRAKYWINKIIKNKNASKKFKEKAKKFWKDHELEKY